VTRVRGEWIDADDFTDGRTLADAIRMVPSFWAANVRFRASVELDAADPDLYALLYFAGD